MAGMLNVGMKKAPVEIDIGTVEQSTHENINLWMAHNLIYS